MNIDQILNSTGRGSADSNAGDEDQGDDTKLSTKTPNSAESSSSLEEKELEQDQTDMMDVEEEQAEIANPAIGSSTEEQLSNIQAEQLAQAPQLKDPKATTTVSPTKRARSASATNTSKELASLSTSGQLHQHQPPPPQLAPLAQSFQQPPLPPPPPPTPAAVPHPPPPLQTYQSVHHLPQYFQYSAFHPYHTHQQLPVPQQPLAQPTSFSALPPPPNTTAAVATQQQYPSQMVHYPEYYYPASRLLPISAPSSPATTSLTTPAFQPGITTTNYLPESSSRAQSADNRKGKSKRIKAPNSTWTLEDDAKLVDLVLRTLPRQDYNEYARILNKRDAQTVRYRWKVIVRRAKGYGMLDEGQ